MMAQSKSQYCDEDESVWSELTQKTVYYPQFQYTTFKYPPPRYHQSHQSRPKNNGVVLLPLTTAYVNLPIKGTDKRHVHTKEKRNNNNNNPVLVAVCLRLREVMVK